MTITIDTDARRKMSLEAFIDHLERDIVLDDPQGLATAAEGFSALASDADLVAAHLNEQIERYYSDGVMATNGPQSILLGKGEGFFLRANIWLPPRLSGRFRAYEERLYSYKSAHDHNFSFMTIGYFGPGYTTDLYRYDPETVTGYAGELVDLEYVGTTSLTPGRVMVYEEKRDVHTQHAPSTLSISLNVMVVGASIQRRDQYYFDPATFRITGMPAFATIHQRASIVEMSGRVANQDTVELLAALSLHAPCRRVRESAIAGLMHVTWLSDSERVRLLRGACSDRERIVRAKAMGAIESICR